MIDIKTFYDTNILLYLFDRNSLKQDRSLDAINSTNMRIISTQVINEFIAIARKKSIVPDSRLVNHIESFEKYFRIVEIDLLTIHLSLEIMNRYKINYWDSLMIASAHFEQCEIIFTEDLQHNQVIEGVRVHNPYI